MTAILLREAVTISRIPDPPRMEGNKKTGEQQSTTDLSDDKATGMDQDPKRIPAVFEMNQMPGKLE